MTKVTPQGSIKPINPELTLEDIQQQLTGIEQTLATILTVLYGLCPAETPPVPPDVEAFQKFQDLNDQLPSDEELAPEVPDKRKKG